MRLELDQTPSMFPHVEKGSAANPGQKESSEADVFLRNGIKAAQAGNRAEARVSLLQAADVDPHDESTWLWLASISEYPEELLVFLNKVLEINPENARALEWTAATKSLLAKTFVQRGIDAVETKQADAAFQYFNQALEYDDQNVMAWLWIASLTDSNEGKITYLEKVLSIDPENEAANIAFKSARDQITARLFAEVKTAAVAGNTVEANALLDRIIQQNPHSEDAWVLRSHLVNGFDQKIEAFGRVLEINPDNAGAKAGLESLTAIIEEAAAPGPTEPVLSEKVEQNAEIAFDEYAVSVNPTAELLFPLKNDTEDLTDTEVSYYKDVDPSDSSFQSDVNGFLAAANNTSPFQSVAEEFQPQIEEHSAEPQPAEYAFECEIPAVEDYESVEMICETPQTAEAAGDAQLFYTAEEDVDGAQKLALDVEKADLELKPETLEYAVEENESPGEEFPSVDYADIYQEINGGVEPFDLENFSAGETAEFVPEDRGEEFSSSSFEETTDVPVNGAYAEENSLSADGFETQINTPENGNGASSLTSACPFCSAANEYRAIACEGCLAILTLADLEMLLADSHADTVVLRQAVERMEREKSSGNFGESELTTLGIGHLNLHNFQYGYSNLYQASQLNPNNVVLGSQVNALLIRLEEIKLQDAVLESKPKGKTIFVIDDSPTVQKLIAAKLERCGHDVVCSNDGEEALDRLQTMIPDLILLDIAMPGMDGYQVCEIIRNIDSTKDVPVIMISGKDGFFDEARGRTAGTSGYITKPFGPETLMKAVETYLKQGA